ncbi:DNA-3-methyladenine glycosylase I [Denitrobaculum tricleocarpae]|uniref:3-methyladenine DNA glycosylase n=1 Tax=Denitrobaculum tricleocarpae TaxID=2591009 RepID=A0A545TFB5_9PROT|nr:DNA-3-methyladenine glycosylase I [Denitrobaculum tricleocarpae]TQV75856.1 3-methyladenine DNA glycosylase [Denitrobaculum tricleocarpae]
MRSYDEIFELAAGRKGGCGVLEDLLSKPKSADVLAKLGDDRWLAGMTRSVFQAGFNWKVIEKKWPGFEEAFESFDPRRWSLMSDEDLDRLVKDTRIVRNAVKILSVRDNAIFLTDLAREHGTAAKCLGNWPPDDYIGLLELLKKRGGRLGGTTAQCFLRQIGKDSFVLSKDVVTALIREGVVEKTPGSKSSMRAVQDAFNTWSRESGRSLTEISRTLAMSVES